MKFKHYLHLFNLTLTTAGKRLEGLDAEDILFLNHLVSLAYEDDKVEKYEADVLYDMFKTEKRNLEDYLEAKVQFELEEEEYFRKLEEGIEL